MARYSLPFDIGTLDENAEVVSIDMSSLNFNVPADQQKKSSFIFLRNAGINADLDFSGCSYKDKEEFLLLYLQEDIDVNAEILSSTWIEILSARDGGGVVLPSILTSEEIQEFLVNNKDFISDVYQLINSLPIYSMHCSPMNGQAFNTDDMPKTDNHSIKITNFAKLSNYDAFVFLIDGKTPGKFYTKLFIKDDQCIAQMMDRLPFLNMLTALFSPPEVQQEIAEGINNFLTPPEVQSSDERKEEPSDE